MHLMLAVINIALTLVYVYYQALVASSRPQTMERTYLCLFTLPNPAQRAVVDCKFIHVYWVRMSRASIARVNS